MLTDVDTTKIHPIVIIGAGLSGIAAAHRLQENGAGPVLLLEKSRGFGGRMATRRVGEATIDHGAQFFTVRDEMFRETVDRWLSEGLVKQWWADPYPRYMALGGMNNLAKSWGKGHAIAVQHHVLHVQENDLLNTFEILVRDNRGDQPREIKIQADKVIMTAPVPQSLELLQLGKVKLNDEVIADLQPLKYWPCLALLLRLRKKGRIAAPGFLREGLPYPLQVIIDQHQKGTSKVPAVTIHAVGDWSDAHYQDSDESIQDDLLTAAAPWVKRKHIEEMQVKRWRYAQPQTLSNRPFVEAGLTQPLYFIGDTFGGDAVGLPRVETAVLSGWKAADDLLRRREERK